jgi:short-subunit dehydrogenase
MNTLPPFAVITGASRGIGAEYARALGAQGYDLLLVARDETRLGQLAEELQKTYSVQVRRETLDLARPNASSTLYHLAHSVRPHVSVLVNNAGFGRYGLLADMPFSTIQDMLQLHIHATTESTRLFLPDMMNQHHGAIINVSSVAGFFPIPYMAEYAATKAFIISFSEAVAMEARESGVTIQV